jgi:hypothetical protein
VAPTQTSRHDVRASGEQDVRGMDDRAEDAFHLRGAIHDGAEQGAHGERDEQQKRHDDHDAEGKNAFHEKVPDLAAPRIRLHVECLVQRRLQLRERGRRAEYQGQEAQARSDRWIDVTFARFRDDGGDLIRARGTDEITDLADDRVLDHLRIHDATDDHEQQRQQRRHRENRRKRQGARHARAAVAEELLQRLPQERGDVADPERHDASGLQG